MTDAVAPYQAEVYGVHSREHPVGIYTARRDASDRTCQVASSQTADPDHRDRDHKNVDLVPPADPRLRRRKRWPARYNDLGAAVMAIAGHDLRQPMQIIIMAHDALARTLLDGAERAQLTRIERSVMVLAGTLDRLVEVLQLQETSCRDSHAPVSLLPIFADLESEFMEPAQLKGIKLRIIPTHAVVSSHPVLLGAMLRNLIRNAIEYTPFGGRVLVGCRRRGAELHIEVRDSGIGLVPSQLSMICRAFHRVDTTRADGLGLGLFIVERAAKFLGHRVEIRSAPGRGSCFVVVVVAERSTMTAGISVTDSQNALTAGPGDPHAAGLVGNNTPVFFARDPLKFPNFIRTQKRHPRTNTRSVQEGRRLHQSGSRGQYLGVDDSGQSNVPHSSTTLVCPYQFVLASSNEFYY